MKYYRKENAMTGACLEKKGINGIVLGIMFAFMILIKPAYIGTIPALNKIWSLCQLVYFAYSVLILLQTKLKNPVKIICCVYILFGMSAIINHADLFALLQKIAPYFSLCILLDFWITKYGMEPLIILRGLLVSYTYINFITIVLYPDGLYHAMTSDGVSYVSCWFLGYKNPQIRTLLITLFLEYLIYFHPQNNNKKLFKSLLLTIVIFISTIAVKSSTALITLCIFVFLMQCLKKDNKWIIRIISPQGLVLLFLIVSIVFVSCQSVALPFISSFIKDFTDKDVSTMSARSYVWKSAIDVVKSNFVFGNGGMQFTAVVSDLYSFNVSHPHNYILYQWLNGGIGAVILSITFMYIVLKKVFRNKQCFCNRLFISLICSVFTMGLVESLTEFPLLYAMFILGYDLNDYLINETKEENT